MYSIPVSHTAHVTGMYFAHVQIGRKCLLIILISRQRNSRRMVMIDSSALRSVSIKIGKH